MKSFSIIKLNNFNRTRARKFVHGLHAVGDISNQFNQTNKQAPNLVVWFQANKRNCWSVYSVNAGVNLVPQQTQWCNGHHPVMRTQRQQEGTPETRYKHMGTHLRETRSVTVATDHSFQWMSHGKVSKRFKGKRIDSKSSLKCWQSC